jgi:hypothetical protein
MEGEWLRTLGLDKSFLTEEQRRSLCTAVGPGAAGRGDQPRPPDCPSRALPGQAQGEARLPLQGTLRPSGQPQSLIYK